MHKYPQELIQLVQMYRWQFVDFALVIFVAPVILALFIHLWRKWDFATVYTWLGTTFAAAWMVILFVLAFSQTDVMPDAVHTFDQPQRAAMVVPVRALVPTVHRRPAAHAKKPTKHDAIGDLLRKLG